MSDHRKSFKDLGKLGKKLKGKKAALEDFIPVFHALIDDIEARGLDVEGILRISGSLPELTALKKSLLKGNPSDISKMDVHISTGLLKTLLRELPEPLLLFASYDPLLKASVMPNATAKLKVMKTIISNLPPVNREILDELVTFAVHISHHEETNRMPPHNIAVVLGPTILRAEKESLESMMRDSMQVVKVVEDMIEHYAELFGNTTIEIQRPVSLNPQEAEFLRKRAASLFPSSVDKSIDEWRADVGKLKEQIREMESRLAEDTREREVLAMYQASLESKLSEAKDDVSQLQGEVAGLQEKVATDANAHTTEMDAAKSDYERQTAALEAQLQEQLTIVSALEKTSTESKQQVSSLKTTNSLLEAKLKASDANAAETGTRLAAAEAKFEALERRASKAESAVSDADTRTSKAEKALADTLAAHKSEVDALKKKHTDLTTENAQLAQKLKVATSAASTPSNSTPTSPNTSTAPSPAISSVAMETANAKIKSLEADLAAAQGQLKTAQDKNLKLEKDNSKLESDLKRAIDANTKAEADMKKAGEDKRASEAELKKVQLALRTSQVEVESLKKELSETVDSSSKAEADERARSAAAIKKVREERSNAELSMKKCQLENSNLESTIKSLTTQNTTMTQELVTLKAAQKTHNSAVKKIQSERDNIESEWKKLQIVKESEAKRYATDLAAAETAIQKVQAEKAAIENERQKIISERSRLNAEIDGLRSELGNLKSEVKRLSVPPSKAPEVELQRIRLEKDDLVEQLQKTKEELDKTHACVEGLERQLAETKKSTVDSPRKSTPGSPKVALASSSNSRPSTPTASEKERELSEQLFSWMTLSLKLESVLQDRQTANYDSGALLHKLLADKTPWMMWPGIISDQMTMKN